MDILLTTERLILRRLTAEDLEAIHAIRLDIARPHPQPTLEDTRDHWLPIILSYYQEGEGFGYWAAVEKASGDLIGWFYFRLAPDEPTDTAIGYFLRHSAWGKGYATEGAQALIHKGFTDLGVRCVVATALVSNSASIRILQKLGFQVDKPIPADASGQEAIRYRLLKEDYRIGRC